jgi:hypothetical protein
MNTASRAMEGFPALLDVQERQHKHLAKAARRSHAAAEEAAPPQ